MIKNLLFYLIILLAILAAASDTKAGVVSGKITNQEGDPLPYATLYIEGTTLGTTSNIEGKYALNVEPGNYYLVFQYVGYRKERIKISAETNPLKLDVVLKAEALTLREVVVNAKTEDPANYIIRQTIKRKKRFSEEINAYQCQVYMKGLQRLDERPSKILGIQVPIDTGIVYLSESVSEITFQRPDKVYERMISSKVSGSQTSFSFNQASQTLFSVYDDLLTVEGLTERGFVSPLAKNAFFFYEYKLEGTVTEGDHLINKIRVYPKRKKDPTFEGYLYIIEDLWRVSSLELTLTKEHQLEFLDELTVKQVHTPVADSTWVMFSQNFKFYLNTFGFKGSGYFSAVYSDYQVELNPAYYEVKEKSKIKADSSSRQRKQFSLSKIDKEYVKNEVLKIEEGSNERDEEYWSQIRPIPLTTVESQDYQIKDHLEIIKGTKNYKDSTDRIRNKLTFGKIAYSGYRYQNSYGQYKLSIPPIYQIAQFNTVEGFLFDLRIKYMRFDKKNTRKEITPELRYGLASNHLYGQLEYKQHLNHQRFEMLTIHGGHFVRQYNGEQPITPLINSLQSLLARNNYLKIYESNFLNLGYQQEIANGLFIKPSLEYSDRTELTNQTGYSFFYRDSKDYTSNTPTNISGQDYHFDKHQALIFNLDVSIRFAQKYMTLPDQKIIVSNKYPKLNIHYSKGIAAFGAHIDYDKLELKVEDDFKLGLWGTSEWNISTGLFLNTNNMEFMDYNHFNTNASIFARFLDDYFQLLDYYYYSTDNYWAEAHYTHHFDGFIFNKLPLIRQSKLQAVAALHYLHTDSVNNYLEFGMGVEHIFKLFRADFFMSWMEGHPQSQGIRLGLGF